MSLTGPVFFALIGGLAVAAFTAVVWSWPRWTGAGTRPVLARGALLLGVEGLVLLTAAVGVNDGFGFFADWTDLAGVVGVAVGQPPASVHVGGGAVAAAMVRLGSGLPVVDRPAAPVVTPGPGGGVFHFTVGGPASGIRGTVEVTLPPGYADPRRLHQRYPVLEAFPGYPGQPFDPIGAVRAAARARELGDAIILSPTVQIPPGRDTECVDATGAAPRVETWLTRDLPRWAARTLRVRTDRASWATIGWSAGGWCAAMAAMLHPDTYAAAIVLGGYFRPDFGSRYVPFGPGSPAARRYDLVALAGHSPPPVALWMQTSRADSLSYPSSAQLLEAVRPPLSVQSLIMNHAGHRIGVWEALLPHALAWLGATLPGFAPPAAPAPRGQPGVRRAATTQGWLRFAGPR